MDQLRMVRQALSEEIAASERCFTSRAENTFQLFSLGKMILPLIKKLKESLSGTPFAKS